MEKSIRIIMGSDSDLPVVEKTAKILERIGVGFEMQILSAHRTPLELSEYVKRAESEGGKVFIGVAGKAAHLPGVIASMTTLPVIGLPIKTSDLGGIDSLLSIVQMPSGIPVATVGINAGENAGLLAAQILSVSNDGIKQSLIQYRNQMNEEIIEKNKLLNDN